MPQLLTASGAASASGPGPLIIDRHAQALTAASSARAQGSAAVTTKLPAGGLTDFGLWINGQPDTAMTRDASHASGSDTAAARGWLTATAPTAYAPGGTPLWNGAVYAGIGVKWAGLTAGERHAFDKVQLETAPAGNRLSWDATSWEGRRCYTGQAGVTYTTVTADGSAALSGTRSGKIVYTGSPPGTFGYHVNPTAPQGMAQCTPGELINGSSSLSMQRAAWWSPALQFYDANFAQLGGTGNWFVNAYRQHPGGGQWDTGYVYSITAPAGAAWVAVVPYVCVNSTIGAVDSVAPVGETAHTDMHRIWARPYLVAGTPTPYVAPRRLTVTIRAGRVNLVNNPGLDTDIWGWGAAGYGTAAYPAAWDATTGRTKPGSLRYSLPANPASYGAASTSGPALLTDWGGVPALGGFGWKTSAVYTSSLYVKLGPGCPPVTFAPGAYTPVAGVLSTDAALTDHPELIEGDWIRLWAAFETDAADDGLVKMLAMISTALIPSGGAVFWVDDAISESGGQLFPAFDGGSPGADYLWAGTAGRSSSHYYRDFRSSAYRLNDVVRAAVPHGTQFDLLYAQPPD